MPDKFQFDEQTGTWVGIYQAPSTPPDQSQRFMRNLHNQVIRQGMPHTRPGKQKLNGKQCGSSGNSTVYGMGIYRGSPDELIIACGKQIQKILISGTGGNSTISGGDPTNLTENYPTGWTAHVGARTIFAQLKGSMYIVNGSDDNKKYNGTNLTRMGLVAPSTLGAPTKASGALNGSYSYKATLVSGTTYGSNESEPTAGLTVTYSSQTGTFTIPTIPSADPQIDRWNLYRAPQGDTTTYYRINTSAISSGTTIADNINDDVLIAGTKIDTSGKNAIPPTSFTTLITHQGRLVGVSNADKNALVWSDQGLDTSGIFFKPESWPAVNHLPFGEQGGTKITALASFFEWLVVFQDFGVWSVKGTLSDSSDRIISPILVAPDTHGIGVSDQGNVAVGENKILFASKTGLYHLVRDLGSLRVELAVKDLSTNVRPLFQQTNFSGGGVAIYDRDQSRWIFWGKGAKK